MSTASHLLFYPDFLMVARARAALLFVKRIAHEDIPYRRYSSEYMLLRQVRCSRSFLRDDAVPKPKLMRIRDRS